MERNENGATFRGIPLTFINPYWRITMDMYEVIAGIVLGILIILFLIAGFALGGI
jgi:hypothetical protein